MYKAYNRVPNENLLEKEEHDECYCFAVEKYLNFVLVVSYLEIVKQSYRKKKEIENYIWKELKDISK